MLTSLTPTPLAGVPVDLTRRPAALIRTTGHAQVLADRGINTAALRRYLQRGARHARTP